jgi:hypothetical protein
MMGTLATMLASKNISISPDNYKAEVKGEIENVNGVLKIARIHLNYFINTEDEKKKDAEIALGEYLPLCPGAQSVIGCIDITDEITFE